LSKEKRKNFKELLLTQMATLVVVKPFRICPRWPLKNPKDEFDYNFNIQNYQKKNNGSCLLTTGKIDIMKAQDNNKIRN